MGSVGEDYRCPLCGREGAGGYAPDALNYPICSEGQYSCLWHKFVVKGFLDLKRDSFGSDVVALYLQRAVAPKHQVFSELELATQISSFLVK